VEIYDAIESVVAILKLDPLLHRTEVITKVEGIACGLDSREDALNSHVGILA
jgi:hypothetical protein